MKNTSDLSITYSLIVNESHIDELEHVNNVVYVGWIQDAAVMHWRKVASDSIQKQYVWVIVRHEIDYKASAKLNDELIIKTYVIDAHNVTSRRKVEIRRKSDNKLLVEGLTTWCLLDAKTFRPTKITEEIRNCFL